MYIIFSFVKTLIYSIATHFIIILKKKKKRPQHRHGGAAGAPQIPLFLQEMTKHPVDVQSGPTPHAEPAQTHEPTEIPSEIQHAPMFKAAGDPENQSAQGEDGGVAL